MNYTLIENKSANLKNDNYLKKKRKQQPNENITKLE